MPPSQRPPEHAFKPSATAGRRRPAAHARAGRPCEYPVSVPVPPELADGLDAGPPEPDTVTSCQTPQDTLSLLPLAWPGTADGKIVVTIPLRP